MFGIGRKKDEAQLEAADSTQEQGERPAGSRARTAWLAGAAVVVGAGLLAYQYLPPGLLDETPPPMPRSPVAMTAALAPAASATTLVPVAVAAAKPESRPAPAAAPAAKPASVIVAAAPAAKPESSPAPVTAPAAKPASVIVAAAPKEPAAVPQPTAEPPVRAVQAPLVVAQVSAPAGAALKYNDVMTAVLFGDRETVTQLLDFGRWADKRDSNGYTPLMVAVQMRDYSMVRLLLERGADPALQAPGGAVALDMARQSGDGAIESLLVRPGGR